MAAVTAGTALAGLIPAAAWAQEPSPPVPAAAATQNEQTQIPAKSRDAVLGKGWKTSTDRAWTTSGDGAGFHLLTADKRSGYAWHTAATLSEPGFDADTWIGNACVTGSGRRAVVAYAPRTFTNKPELMARGAFTAVVDLDNGQVTKLDRQASLAYFSPGCGTGESAVFTQAGGLDKSSTRLLKVNAATATLSKPLEVAGQVTSAVPVSDAIVAADSNRLVRITDDGRRTPLVRTRRVPFLLKPDADGGVVFMDRAGASGQTGEVRRIASATGPRPGRALTGAVDKPRTALPGRSASAAASSSLLATGPLTSMDVTASSTGRVFITGAAKAKGALPASVELRPRTPVDSVATTRGESMVTRTAWADGNAMATNAPERPVAITLAPGTVGKPYAFEVTASAQVLERSGTGAARSPALAAPAAPRPTAGKRAGALTGPIAEDTDTRYCAVARNDPNKQALQPKPRQVEWAVDQAITGNLNKFISRPANWKNLGMAAYQPQFLFPLHDLDGGGRVPAQVMLGITAQESNMWQASRVAVPGVTGNPLVGNFYGVSTASSGQQTDPWAIHWENADCGYGVTQVTDGMRLAGKEKKGETAMSVTRQEAVALDYTANIAAGVNILIDKWNQTRREGLVINNGDPKYLENWFFALWAYNTGFYPKDKTAENHGVWGVGFTNNPANPIWKANRRPFLQAAGGGDNYADAAHPQDWPYQEKVLGWAARPLSALESPGTMVAGYRQAWWNNDYYRTTVKPSESLFCTAANECDPSKIGDNDSNEPGQGACTRSDLYCFWNQPVSWKNCTNGECGNETLRFNSTYPEEADGTAYPPNCTTSGLPAGALIVDDVPPDTPAHRPNCTPPPTTGSFSFDFGTDSARMDLHQLGAGFGSHFYFAHTRKNDLTGSRMQATGVWSLGRTIAQGQAKVFVHLPDHGAQTAQATYQIVTSAGTRNVTINQKGTSNRWAELGTYRFSNSVPQVKLSTITGDGTGDQDIAFDAVAFVPGRYSAVDITLPAPQPDAPAPNFPMVLQPTTGPPSASGVHGLARQAPAAPGKQCTKRGEGAEVCWTIRKLKAGGRSPAPKDTRLTFARPGQEPRGVLVAPAGAAGNNNNLVPWCDNGFRSMMTRFEACLDLSEVGLTFTQNGVVVGQAFFQISGQLKADPNGRTITQQLNIFDTRQDPALGQIEMRVFPQCASACDMSTMQWDQPLLFTGPSAARQGTATATYNRTSPLTSAFDRANQDHMLLGWSIDAFSTGAGKKAEPDPYQLSLGVPYTRCDVAFNSDGPGCVFADYHPTYVFNSKQTPAAAAHAWLMMSKLPKTPGVPATPLRYLPIKERNHGVYDPDRNRNVICPSGWAANYGNPSTTPFTDRNSDDRASCDEYPFAATYQSGGMPYDYGGTNPVDPVRKGDACVQTYATKLSDGTWKLLDDERAELPDWKNSVCGRSAMSSWINTTSMSTFPVGASP
ncbi:hypothetical protein [Streptomyces sp. NPDC056160]|uniref:golvesin C-terminal-like domain-containing protein n=1 Tax=Streptomyces sp. NPDC056160 TaxID=3345731 RepID=UPI0035E01D55